MGTGYTRNDTGNNIADGNVINAADFDGEYDAIEAAFNSSSGHTHDGTSAEGAPIEVLGPSQDVVITASVLRPKTNNTVDLGTSSLKFKDGHFEGTLNVDGGLTPNQISVTSTDAGVSKGPQLDIFRESASPADNDALGHIDFSGEDDGDNKTVYASILATALDVTDGTEDGSLKFNTMVAGSDTTIATISADGLTVDGNTLVNVNTGGYLAVSGNEGQDAKLVIQSDQGDNSQDITTLIQEEGGDFTIATQNGSDRIKIGATTGDISFYEDTGTTAKLFWDASAEGLSLGHTGNTSILDVLQSDANTDVADVNSGAKFARVNSSGNGQSSGLFLLASGNGGSNNGWAGMSVVQPDANSNNADLTFITRGSSIAERMRIDSDGKVGIGTDSPSHSLTVQGGSVTESQLSLTTSSASILAGNIVGGIDFRSNDNNGIFTAAKIQAIADSSHNGGAGLVATSLVFSNNTERMRIDSSGNVGIGVSTPSDYFANANNLVVGDTSDHAGMSIVTGTSHEGTIAFADGTSGNAQYRGYLQYNHSVDRLVIGTAGSETMRISGGNLLVGKTSSATNTVGVEIDGANGVGVFTRDGNTAIEANRKTSDGTIINLRKDGTTAGSIGAVSDEMYLGSGDAGLYFWKAQSKVIPWKAGTNAASNELIDLGDPSYKFKDLYLSGGIQFDSRSNKLDDYEEGSWTPACTGSLSVAGASYVKVGNLVNASLYITSINPTASSSVFQITGLPYAVKTSGGYYVAGTIGYTGDNNLNDVTVLSGTTLSHLYFHLNDGDSGAVTGNEMRTRGMTGASLDALIISISYQTA